jgi:hypothetical protein
MIQFTLGAGPAINTEAWQLYQPNQPPLCVYQLEFVIPAASTVATPLYSYLAAPAGASVIAAPGGLLAGGPFAAMDGCAQSGFYMYIVECTPVAPGVPFQPFDDCVSYTTPAAAVAAAAVAAAGRATTQFVVAFVGRTEEQLAERYRQHRKEINGVNARSAQGVTWRSWFETRRSFFVGFPAADSLATALQMMLVRPFVAAGSSGFKFPLNDESSWPGRLPPSTISLRGSIASPSVLLYRELATVACVGAAAPALALQLTALAAAVVSNNWGGIAAFLVGLTCPGAGGMPAWAMPPLQEGAPGPGWTSLNSIGAPTFAGAPIALPQQFAFDVVPGGATPHKATMTALEWRTILNGALLSLEGTRQMIGAAMP